MNAKKCQLCQKNCPWSPAQAVENQSPPAANQQNFYAQAAAKSKSNETENAANLVASTNAPNVGSADHKKANQRG